MNANAYPDLIAACEPLSETTIRKHIRAGLLPGRFITRQLVFVPRGEFDEFVAGRWLSKVTPEPVIEAEPVGIRSRRKAVA